MDNNSSNTTLIYDFEGKVLQSRTYHNGGGTNQTTVINKTSYDIAGIRPVQMYQNIDNATTDQLVAQYDYNELGQVVDKKLHKTSSGAFLQSVDYRYNIRGWLSSINNAGLNNDGVTNDDTNDYFGIELLYHRKDAGIGNSVRYDGSITASKWNIYGSTGQTNQRSYNYTYDKSDRVRAGTFKANNGTVWTKETNTLNESLNYDHNGNILNLQRNQADAVWASQTIDNITYS